MVNFFDTRIGRYVRKWKYNRIFNKLSKDEIAIDCGANVGKITKRLSNTGATVYAFEPDPNAYKVLVRNLENVKNVVLINKAVSDHGGKAKIYFNDRYKENPEKWSTASTMIAEKPHVDLDNFTEVEVVDLADFIRSLDKHIGLLKIDVEGEEVKILNKLIDENLAGKIRDILVETHERFPVLKVETEALKKKIKEQNIKNIDLDWA